MAVSQRIRKFHSFNAKYLPPEDVAATFIPPPQWDTMIQNGHALLVGPRGAGKTSIFKMLTSRGITSWQRIRAIEDRGAMAFVGVFVTTDRTWSEQVSAIGDGLTDKDQVAFGVATFSAHVLHALVEAAADRIHSDHQLHPVAINATTEADIASQVAEEWDLTRRPVVTLRGLQHALTDRIANIADLAEKESLLELDGRDQRLAEQLPGLNFDKAALQLIDRFNTAANEPDRPWCFLFDELELAPPAVVTQLTRGLRGGDRRLLFKLSLAPYTDSASQLRAALSAQQAHDYQVEQLTYPHKKDPLEFCRALLAQKLGLSLEELDVVRNEEVKVLGRSQFAADPHELGADDTAYKADSARVEAFKELATADATFTDWLRDKDIDLDRLENLEPDRRAATVRKIATIAMLRQAYRTSDETFTRTGRRRRPRKTYSMFAGLPALYDMVEGNPRWFMNLIAPMLEEGGAGTNKGQQGRHIREVVRLFRAILTAIPLPPSEARRHKLGVLPVLDAIGSRLSAYVVDNDFNADPPAKFKVDDDTPDEVVHHLQFAVNAGGIVHMPGPDDDQVLDDLRGQTFRLAHMLAPWYPIPLTTGGRTLDLSTLLEDQPISWEFSHQLEIEDEHTLEEYETTHEDGQV
jgi:hypothetical protein